MLGSLTVGLAGASGCGTLTLAYDYETAAPAFSSTERQHSRLAVVDILDGRDDGLPSTLPFVKGRTKEETLSAIRTSIRGHATRAGVVESNELLFPAPSDQAGLQSTLAAARDAGATAVLVTRLELLYAEGRKAPVVTIMEAMALTPLTAPGALPLVVVGSMKINSEYTAIRIRGFIVDPSTELVTSTFEELYEKDEPEVTAWRYHPPTELKDGLFETMEGVFANTASALHADRPAPDASQPLASIFEPAEEGTHR